MAGPDRAVVNIRMTPRQASDGAEAIDFCLLDTFLMTPEQIAILTELRDSLEGHGEFVVKERTDA